MLSGLIAGRRERSATAHPRGRRLLGRGVNAAAALLALRGLDSASNSDVASVVVVQVIAINKVFFSQICF